VSASPAFASGAGGRIVPRHVAIIMDGNGRWAKARMLPRIAGHRRGIEAAREVVRNAGNLGIEVLTLYAFSSENWRRPAEEVSDLMGLLRHFIQNDIDELAKNGVRLRVIGDFRALAPDLVTMIDAAVARTAGNDGLLLVIALNYGSQAELANVAKQLARRAADGSLDPEAITPEMISGLLETAEWPTPDLLIRTSGEKRLSNFMLWQLAYTEFVFESALWPDFGARELNNAVEIFAARERRYGGL
jgi:undecaprenyl diphosphate synthase